MQERTQTKKCRNEETWWTTCCSSREKNSSICICNISLLIINFLAAKENQFSFYCDVFLLLSLFFFVDYSDWCRCWNWIGTIALFCVSVGVSLVMNDDDDNDTDCQSPWVSFLPFSFPSLSLSRIPIVQKITQEYSLKRWRMCVERN